MAMRCGQNEVIKERIVTIEEKKLRVKISEEKDHYFARKFYIKIQKCEKTVFTTIWHTERSREYNSLLDVDIRSEIKELLKEYWRRERKVSEEKLKNDMEWQAIETAAQLCEGTHDE